MHLSAQLDLFADSPDVALRNAVASALLARDAAAAQQALLALAREFPLEPLLPAYATLLMAIAGAVPRLSGHAAAGEAMDALAGGLTLAAHQALPRNTAFGWLAPLWQELAQAMDGLPYRAASAQVHAAVAFLRAHDWPAAQAAVQGIPSWRRIPYPLSWMAEARFGENGLAEAWPLLAELAWLAPLRFDELARQLDSPALTRYMRAFASVLEMDSTDASASSAAAENLAWLPAFVLIADPAQGSYLRQAQGARASAPERTMWHILQILDLERQGRHADLIDARRKLRALHPGLFQCYMQTRQ